MTGDHVVTPAGLDAEMAALGYRWDGDTYVDLDPIVVHESPMTMQTAATLIQGAAEAIDKILDQIDADLEQYAADVLGHEPGRSQEENDQHDIETGYRALMDACFKIETLVKEPDRHVSQIIHDGWDKERAS